MNAHIESYHRLLEDECFAANEFETFSEVDHAVMAYVEFYNGRRLYSSLRYLPPVEFLRRHREEGLTPARAVRV